MFFDKLLMTDQPAPPAPKGECLPLDCESGSPPPERTRSVRAGFRELEGEAKMIVIAKELDLESSLCSA